LLDLDRVLGRKLQSKDPEQANFGFFSEEAPGTGADISFSEYEAFALSNGLRIMGHGWPQGFAVSIMRRVRSDLEREHARILKQDPVQLFDQRVIRAKAREGDIAVDNTDPVFLVLASKEERASDAEQIPSIFRRVPRTGEDERLLKLPRLSCGHRFVPGALAGILLSGVALPAAGGYSRSDARISAHHDRNHSREYYRAR
jgi:hypothetical protein